MDISVQHLTIGYRDKVIQKDLSFSLNKGKIVALLGPNGVGKTTLLRTLAGLQPAMSGTVAPLLTERNRTYVLTNNNCLDNTTVHDIVAMGRYPYTSFLGTLSDEDEKIIIQSLSAVGYDNAMLYRTFNSLSDGEKQRVLLAKALAQQTDLILLDEPTSHLDLPNRIRVFRLLRDLAHNQGKTVLISTHELDLASEMSDYILLLSEQGLQIGTAEQLRATDAFEKAFKMDVFHYLN
ncbi:MAG: ABC transporter ATP-binding protein [Paludibacteraceae bacterium]|nr:ABC transporter ATP-binding protein [Paludibacteraceae bacterium]